MDLGIAGRVALVSGGSKGMGRSVAEALAREGARVVVAARSPEGIEEAVAAIRAAGGEADGVAGDMSAKADVAAAVARCAAIYGRTPDIAVANVWGTARQTFDEADDDAFRAGFETLVMSAAFLARAVLPGMKERRWGRIVTIGSFCAKKPHWHIPLAVDNVGRAAALALSKTLSNEAGPFGVTVNTIGPGFIGTDMAQGWMASLAEEQGRDPAAAEAERNARIPVGRWGRPDEIGAVAAFLCSDLASYVTGQLVMVDGGYVETVM